LALSDEDVREILRIIDSSQLDELTIETPAFSLHVSKGKGATAPSPRSATALDPPPAPPKLTPPPPATPASPTPAPAVGATSEIVAPMLGTFYRTESPSHPPFVEVGDGVRSDTVVCLIEVMTLMNHIQAGVAGTIVEVLAQSGELVEFGQPLFRVAPDGA
jgi:acetyl-CoA carboxylase biotin carboxyl carrier protein